MSSLVSFNQNIASILASPQCELVGELLCAAEEARHALRAALAREGLTLDGFAALGALDRVNAPVSASTLADEVGTTRTLLGHTLNRLQLSGLVMRRPVPATENRIVRIHVTPLGKKTINRAVRSCRATLRRLTRELTPVQTSAALNLCKAVRRAAQNAL